MRLEDTMGSVGAGSAVDRWLGRALRIVAALLVVAVASLGAYWYGQRYLHPTVSVVDRDMEILESQIRAQPNDPQLRVAVASLYIEKGRFDEAIVQAEQVLRVNDGNLLALLALGRAYIGKGDLDQAAAYLSRAVESSRNSPMARASLQLALVHQLLGTTYLKQGRVEEAIGELRAALEIDRTDADTLRTLGNALASRGETEGAILAYRQALRLVPDFSEVYADLQRVYEQQGDRDRAAFAAAMVSFTSGRYDQAEAGLRRAVEALPDLMDAHLGLGMTHEKLGRPTEALAEYRLAAELDPTSIAAKQGMSRAGGQGSGNRELGTGSGGTR